MATEVYKKKEITLQDGTEVLLRPLPINRLRKFMKAWEGMGTIDPETQDGFDVLLDCAGISIEDSFKGKFVTKSTPEEQEKGKFLSDEYKEYLGDVLDVDTIYEILRVCGDLDLESPKLQEALETAATA